MVKYIFNTRFFYGLLFLLAGYIQARDTRPENTIEPPRQTQDQVVVIKFKAEASGLSKTNPAARISTLQKMQQIRIDGIEPLMAGPTRLKKSLGAVGIDRIYFVHYNGSQSPQQVAKALADDPALEYAEPKYIQQLCATPNDSLFSVQSYLNVLNLPRAWDIARGSQGNAIIAVVDGGTEIRHPDLQANIWHNSGETPGNGLDDDQNGYIDDINGWNFINKTGDPTGLEQTPINAEHGTHTAGLAGAAANNSIGIAGASWNAKLMAINAGSAYSDNAITSGYEGILYAGENGADIISCSWGSLGSPSLYEQDVIEHVVQLGAIVIAAAGNDNKNQAHYPSSYKNVLSVAAINSNGQKASFSNYGKFVDVVSPGLNILSTIPQGEYATISGTSMAAPLVAGVAGLVKTLHPDWTGIQAAEQVRMTAVNVDALNPAYEGLLGRGRVDAYAALTVQIPSIRISQVRFVDQNQDGTIKPGESVQIAVNFINYLAPATAVSAKLSDDSDYTDLINPDISIGAIGTMQEISNAPVFAMQVRAGAPRGHVVNFKLDISAGDYQDSDRFSLTVLPTFGNIEINRIATSVTNIGRIGFGNADESLDGIGFKYEQGPNLLFEGALIVGTGPDRIVNAARGIASDGALSYDEDFSVAQDGDLEFRTPGLKTDQESKGIFTDLGTDNPLNIKITQNTFASSAAAHQDFVILAYRVQNTGNGLLNPLYFGFFFDWDMDGGHYDTNLADYDAQRKLGYAYDSGDGPDTYVGMALLSEGPAGYRAIFNDGNHPLNNSWGIYDGYTDAEKWESISSGVTHTKAGPADISHCLSAGPYSIPAGTDVDLVFAFIAGHNLQELQQHTDNAKLYWDELKTTQIPPAPVAPFPQTFNLEQNYPNPFNPGTTISYALPKTSRVTVDIYNLIGQLIRSLVDETQNPGQYRIQWDGKDHAAQTVPAGAYLYRLHTEEYSQVRKMILIK